jgi:hypothetical protein
MRRVHKLTARKVETAKPGRYGDGQGLWLAVAETGACKWVFRFTWQRKVTETGVLIRLLALLRRVRRPQRPGSSLRRAHQSC